MKAANVICAPNAMFSTPVELNCRENPTAAGNRTKDVMIQKPSELSTEFTTPPSCRARGGCSRPSSGRLHHEVARHRADLLRVLALGQRDEVRGDVVVAVQVDRTERA